MKEEETKQEEVKEETLSKVPGAQPEQQTPPAPKTPPARQLIIETNGTEIKVVKAEVTNLEFQAILENLLRNFQQSKQ